jgi:hypothetical protein
LGLSFVFFFFFFFFGRVWVGGGGGGLFVLDRLVFILIAKNMKIYYLHVIKIPYSQNDS